MQPEVLTVGSIGAGFNARFQGLAWHNVRDINVTGVFSPEGTKEYVDECHRLKIGDPRVCGSIEELCEVSQVLSISVPNHYRLQTMEQVAKYGKGRLKGVICEKPLARTVAEARQMVKLATDAGIPTFYAENQNFMPLITRGRAQLAALEAGMGAPYFVRAEEKHCGAHSNWFWNPLLSGGGVGNDMLCHSIAVGRLLGTPFGKPLDFMVPVSVTSKMSCSKWGRKKWRQQLLETRGVDYSKHPAEDNVIATYVFRNPETNEEVEVLCINSWSYAAPGLELSMQCLFPGLALDICTLSSPGHLFVADYATGGIGDKESALEKCESGKGSTPLMDAEEITYGYTHELRSAVESFREGKDGCLNFGYGLGVVQLVMSAYLAHERGKTLKFDDQLWADLETYQPLIAQGRGREVLYIPA